MNSVRFTGGLWTFAMAPNWLLKDWNFALRNNSVRNLGFGITKGWLFWWPAVDHINRQFDATGVDYLGQINIVDTPGHENSLVGRFDQVCRNMCSEFAMHVYLSSTITNVQVSIWRLLFSWLVLLFLLLCYICFLFLCKRCTKCLSWAGSQSEMEVNQVAWRLLWQMVHDWIVPCWLKAREFRWSTCGIELRRRSTVQWHKKKHLHGVKLTCERNLKRPSQVGDDVATPRRHDSGIKPDRSGAGRV